MSERRSALAEVWAPGRHGSLGGGAARVSFAALADLSIVQVAAFDDAAASTAIKTSCGGLPPAACNTTTLHGDIRMLSIGPGRWLLIAPEAQDVPARLIGRIPAEVATITDLSHGRTVVRVGGPDTRRLLAKTCTLDLDSRVFTPGRCALTLFGQAGVLLDAVSDDVVDVYFNRSYAVSGWEILADAAAEYGCSVV